MPVSSTYPYEAIAAKANLARSTVASALRRLKDLGVLNWLRRCEEAMEDGRYVLRRKRCSQATELSIGAGA